MKLVKPCDSPTEICVPTVAEVRNEFGDIFFERMMDCCADCAQSGFIKSVEGTPKPDHPEASMLAKAVGYQSVVATTEWGDRREVTRI